MATLMYAIVNFDGSIEALQQIGLIVSSVREGELKLLAQIDAIQKGITVSLERLKNEILGIGKEQLTGEQLFNQAQALISALSSAASPGEVAALAQQFESIIRQIAPIDQAAMQGELVTLIETFQAAADATLDLQRQAVIDNAQAMRELVDVFINDIGDPLAIIAASNARAAEALEAIATGTNTTDAIREHNIITEDILDQGMDNIATAIGTIGPIVGDAVMRAVRGVNVIVNVTVEADDLVTE